MSIVLITGSTRGIGRATARQLVAEGDTVIITSRDKAAADAGVAELGDTDDRVAGLALDVTDPESVRAAEAWVRKTYGALDVLVNNAGALPEAGNADPREVVDLFTMRESLAVNMLGPTAMIEAFLPLLRESPRGRIVNVSTRMASLRDQLDVRSPYYAMVVPGYQASKAALNSLTIGLSKALADSNVTVAAVCPGFVRTDLTPMNREQAPLEPEDAARVIVTAVRNVVGSTGTFSDAAGPVPW